MYRLIPVIFLMVLAGLLACSARPKATSVTPVTPSENKDTPIVQDTAGAVSSSSRTTVKEVSFSRDVLPILKELAGECHSGDNQQGEYGLDSYEAVMAGGTDSVPNVIPGDPEGSLLYIYLLKGHPFGVKPDSGKLRVIYNWIRQGAKNN